MSLSSQAVCEHIGIFVKDIKKMNAFYTRHLGFSLQKDYKAGRTMMKEIFNINSSCRIQYLTRGNFGIELFYFEEVKLKTHSVKQPGYNHWTIYVKDKYRFCASLRRKKIPVIKIIKPHGHTFFIKDVEKNLIEVKSLPL